MEPKKSCEKILYDNSNNNNHNADEDEEEEEETWEEVEADLEDEREKVVGEEEEILPDPNIEEDPEEEETETETEENYNDNNKMNTKDSDLPILPSFAVECISYKPNNPNDSEEFIDEFARISSPTPSNFIVMPIRQKRPSPSPSPSPSPNREKEIDHEKKKKKAAAKATATAATARKRNNDIKSSPNLVVSSSAGGGRVWCREDEITVLEGMIAYKNREGTYPPNDMSALLEFIKLKLISDMTRGQLYDKVRRLKKKFLLNLDKIDDATTIIPKFSRPHDSLLFDLSRQIWGNVDTNTNTITNTDAKANTKSMKRMRTGDGDGEDEGESSTDDDDDWRKRKDGDGLKRWKKFRKNMKSRKQRKQQQQQQHPSIIKDIKEEEVVTMEHENLGGDFETKYPYLTESVCNEKSVNFVDDSVKKLLKEKLRFIDRANAKELDLKWKKIREQESEILLQKMNLIALQTELMLKGSKKQ